jgi:hypothetical protein
MSREQPAADCHQVIFAQGVVMEPAAEVALEDYARVLTRARAAEAFRAGEDGPVSGVHLCGLAARPAPALLADLEAFARDLAMGARGGGLGWG